MLIKKKRLALERFKWLRDRKREGEEREDSICEHKSAMEQEREVQWIEDRVKEGLEEGRRIKG